MRNQRTKKMGRTDTVEVQLSERIATQIDEEQ